MKRARFGSPGGRPLQTGRGIATWQKAKDALGKDSDLVCHTAGRTGASFATSALLTKGIGKAGRIVGFGMTISGGTADGLYQCESALKAISSNMPGGYDSLQSALDALDGLSDAERQQLRDAILNAAIAGGF